MRMIVAIQLNNGKVMHIIGDVKNKEDARATAAKLSKRLWGDSELYVYNTSHILSADKWSQDKQCSFQHGNKMYMISFLLDGSTQVLHTEAAGIKSAYNSIKVRYGIEENIFAMVYEVNQSTIRASAMSEASKLIKSEDKTNELIDKTVNKIKSSLEYEDIQKEIYKIHLIKSLIIATRHNKYDKCSLMMLTSMLASIIYFYTPYEYSYDVNGGNSNFTGVEALKWMITQSNSVLYEYNKWLQGVKDARQRKVREA